MAHKDLRKTRVRTCPLISTATTTWPSAVWQRVPRFMLSRHYAGTATISDLDLHHKTISDSGVIWALSMYITGQDHASNECVLPVYGSTSPRYRPTVAIALRPPSSFRATCLVYIFFYCCPFTGAATTGFARQGSVLVPLASRATACFAAADLHIDDWLGRSAARSVRRRADRRRLWPRSDAGVTAASCYVCQCLGGWVQFSSRRTTWATTSTCKGWSFVARLRRLTWTPASTMFWQSPVAMASAGRSLMSARARVVPQPGKMSTMSACGLVNVAMSVHRMLIGIWNIDRFMRLLLFQMVRQQTIMQRWRRFGLAYFECVCVRVCVWHGTIAQDDNGFAGARSQKCGIKTVRVSIHPKPNWTVVRCIITE